MASGALDRAQIRCEDCELQPALKDAYGCGYPPWRDLEDPTRKFWDAQLGRRVSPAELVRMGLPAYRNLGYGGAPKADETGFEGGVRIDWPHCPRWHHRFSRATVGGGPTVTVMRRAAEWYEARQLALLSPGPFTPGFLRLLEWQQILESWAEQRRAAERAQQGG